MLKRMGVRNAMTAKELSVDIITYAGINNYQITNLKLQKTLYYLQGYYSKKIGSPLFTDDFEHWPYGPVIPSVYFAFCSFGADAIDVEPSAAPFSEYNSEEKKVIRDVINKCLSMTARSLVEQSHKESPWLSAKPSGVISYNSISHYFQEHDPLELEKRKRSGVSGKQ